MKDRIECEYKATKPDDIPFTLTVTMKLGDWCKIKDHLEGRGDSPSWHLRRVIEELVEKARLSFGRDDEYNGS